MKRTILCTAILPLALFACDFDRIESPGEEGAEALEEMFDGDGTWNDAGEEAKDVKKAMEKKSKGELAVELDALTEQVEALGQDADEGVSDALTDIKDRLTLAGDKLDQAGDDVVDGTDDVLDEVAEEFRKIRRDLDHVTH